MAGSRMAANNRSWSCTLDRARRCDASDLQACSAGRCSRILTFNDSAGGRSAVLCEFDRGNRPPSIMALQGDAQAVKFIKPELLHRAGLSVRQYHGLADKLGLRLFKRAENSRSTELHGWHGCLRRAARLSRRGVGLVRLCVQTTALRNL